jgi:ABC-type Mn2+/Zn2+ transport system permease subunit
MLLLVAFQRPLLLTIFEASVAKTQGVPVGMLLGMLILLIVLAMVSSLQAVGVLLSLGLLILPAATIYLLSDSFDVMLWGGAALGTFGAVVGLLVSFWANIPSGPAIVLILGILFLLAYLFSPRYGIISRHFKRRHLHEESLERWEKK